MDTNEDKLQTIIPDSWRGQNDNFVVLHGSVFAVYPAADKSCDGCDCAHICGDLEFRVRPCNLFGNLEFGDYCDMNRDYPMNMLRYLGRIESLTIKPKS